MARTAKPAAAGPEAAKGHVAVVYFHGMGNQRRYEEVSRLIDGLDRYLSNEYRERGASRGMLVGIRPRLEPEAGDARANVTYIAADFVADRSAPRQAPAPVRFYEAYWAPVMAGTSSPRRVALWMLRQCLRPWQTLTSPWRDRQRLRRAALAELAESPLHWPEGVVLRDFDDLLAAYAAFDNAATIRTYRSGRFAEFLAWLDTDAKTAGRAPVRALAVLWERRYRLGEMRNGFGLITALLALALVAGALVWSVLRLLQLLAGASFMRDESFIFGRALQGWLDPSFGTAAGLVVSLGLALGLGRFLTAYMGDVEAWATYEETDEKHERRARVMASGCALLTHVLNDPKCARVVVVAHSLGTSVAHDTLLALANSNRARNAQDPIAGPVPLDKIRHFVTMGSPIDKINYFFESYRSAWHRYGRVIETLRGDISEVPFSRNGKPYIHWVNYWDEADVISGPLQSPVGPDSLAHLVDNVHVANLRFPSPGRSHSAYFESRVVVGQLFEAICLNRHSYADAPLKPDGKGYDLAARRLGPGEGRGRAAGFHAGVLALPWIGLAYLVFFLADLRPLAAASLWLMLGVGLALVAARLGGRGHRLRI